MFQTHGIANRRTLSIIPFIAISLALFVGITWGLLGENTHVVTAIAVVLFLLTFIGTVVSGPLVLLWTAIVCLAFLTLAPLDPLARAGLADPGYSLFRTYFLDILSTWDILLFMMLAVLFSRSALSPKSSRLTSHKFRNRTIDGYFALLLVAILIGLVIILTGQSHVFVFRDWARAVRPIVYLFTTYTFVVSVVKSRNDIRRTSRLLEAIAFAMVIYGLVRLQLVLSGRMLTLWPFGIPLVLYSELAVFDFPMILYGLKMWNQRRVRPTQLLMILAMITYKLASTRRFVYVDLVLYFAIAVILGQSVGLLPSIGRVLVKSRWMIGILVIGVIVAQIIVPGLLDAIINSVITMNIFSGRGFEYTGEFRLLEISNIFLNLSEKPLTWLMGYGIGSKWYTFQSLPWGTDEVGSYMAFDATIRSGGSAWLPFFHVPYFSTLFRFGLLGCLILILIVRNLLTGYIQVIRSVSDVNEQLCLVALLTMIPVPILLLGDSPTPAGYIWIGIYLGLLESYRLTMVRIPQRTSEQA